MKLIPKSVKIKSILGHESSLGKKKNVPTTKKQSIQKQPSRRVLRKRCSGNMQQIYRRTPMPKSDFNKVLSIATVTFIILILEDYMKHSVIRFSWDQIKGLKRKVTAFKNVERMTKHSFYVSKMSQTFWLHSRVRHFIMEA